MMYYKPKNRHMYRTPEIRKKLDPIEYEMSGIHLNTNEKILLKEMWKTGVHPA